MCSNHDPAGAGRLPRRRVLSLLAALTASALVRVRAAEANGPYLGPIIDAHAHMRQGVAPDPAGLLALYDRVGIQGSLLFGEPWTGAVAARDLAPDRIIPLLQVGYSRAVHPETPHARPEELDDLLTVNGVRGLGEVICRHAPYSLGARGGGVAGPRNDVPADHPMLVEAYRRTGAAGGVVNIHQEWPYADELERAVQAAPETPFIWAHIGHGDADLARRLLSRNPNLHADISARSPWLGPTKLLTGEDGLLTPAWASLLRDYADRFLLGFDFFVRVHFEGDFPAQMVNYYRHLLGQLEPEVAGQIAFGNAQRLAPFAGG